MTNYRLPFDDSPSPGFGEAGSPSPGFGEADPPAASARQVPDTVESRIDARDRAGRDRAVDPRFNVALEASAGTGKTRILVNRYVNLLKAGVDPGEILALTFTRKAAAEMRERIVATLRDAAARGEFPRERWRQLRDRTADVTISTIDAFCLSLLREFPLEAGLDPGFSMADETEVPRLVSESLDRALRICRTLATEDEHVALVFAQLGDRRARAGLAVLLDRRIAAPAVLSRFLSAGPRDLTLTTAAHRGAVALMDVFAGMRGGLDRFLETGPLEPPFLMLRRQLRALETRLQCDEILDPAEVHAAFSRAREHFLTQDGEPRTSRLLYSRTDFASATDWQVHRDLVFTHAAGIIDAYAAYRRDLNVLVSRGVWRMFKVAEAEYRRTLDAHAVLDFPDLLLHARQLLGQMEEFAQSRYRLESRYHHVLVDEFQDTSRAQWDLVALLTQSWGEGAGLADSGPLHPTVFIVGDRKQSIYAFRDADVSMLREAARHLEGLRPGGDVKRSISRSYRSVPQLLAFVNDLCHDIDKAAGRPDAFQYEEEDRFPIEREEEVPLKPDTTQEADALAILTGDAPEACAETTAAEIARLMSEGALVRDRTTGVRRPIRPGDVAILFRTRESHREFEEALERYGLPSYVYKGLGFFDADEIKDVLALLWYLADPLSNLRAAAWLRSRFVGISDEGLRRMAAFAQGATAGLTEAERRRAPALAEALSSQESPAVLTQLDADDADALNAARASSRRWRALVDRMPPAELLDCVLEESAYLVEMRGPRFLQARENLKKIRAIIRRIQNRGYATLDRIASHLDRLAVGDDANAAIDASDAVSLMTVHAAKGLEFPVVFVVNLARGTANRRAPIRIATSGDADGSVAVGDFQSSGDEDQADKEREETKRLLYVAVTRARDRLYLGTVLKDGVVQPGRGSLAEVLPASLIAQFAEAAGTGVVTWRAASGASHAIRVCAASPSPPAGGAADRAMPALSSETDFARLDDNVPSRQTVASMIAGTEFVEASLQTRLRDDTQESDRLVGSLVHRLLQREGLAVDVSDDWVAERLGSLVRVEESIAVADRDAVIRRATAAYRAFTTHQELRALYLSGTAFHEVPFSLSVNDRIVRGTIDCLVQKPDGELAVLEFKTGRRRPEHEAQTALYQQAAAALFPGQRVVTQLLYAADTDIS